MKKLLLTLLALAPLALAAYPQDFYRRVDTSVAAQRDFHDHKLHSEDAKQKFRQLSLHERNVAIQLHQGDIQQKHVHHLLGCSFCDHGCGLWPGECGHGGYECIIGLCCCCRD